MGDFNFTSAALKQLRDLTRHQPQHPQSKNISFVSQPPPKNSRSISTASKEQSSKRSSKILLTKKTSNKSVSIISTNVSPTSSKSTVLRPDAPVFHPSARGTASTEQPYKLPRGDKNLINKVINPDSYTELQLVELKKSDHYGYIYQARQLTTELLFEVKVYCLSQQDQEQKKNAKRNLREWKSRRRYWKSFQENGLVFLILRYPKPQAESPSPAGPEDRKLSSPLAQVDVSSGENSMLRENIPQFQPSAIRAILEDSTSKIPGQHRTVLLPPAAIFFCNFGHRLQEQQQKARRLQRDRRRKRRASITSGGDNLQDKQTADPEGFVPKHPTTYSDFFSSQWGGSNFTEDELSRDQDWYWSGEMGWRREMVILEENGHSKWAYRWSTQGGYLNRHITGPELKPTTVYYGPVVDFRLISPSQLDPKPIQLETQDNLGNFHSNTDQNGTSLADCTLEPLHSIHPLRKDWPATFSTSEVVASSRDIIQNQLEFYFSTNNLHSDTYLRKHMDSQGFVPLCFVANFKRLQSLTQDIDVLRSTCMESDIIELRRDIDGVDHIRPKEGWEKMVLEMEQRDLSARNGGPRMGMWSEPCLCGIGEGERELVMKDNFDIHFGDFVLKIAKSRPPGAKKRSFSTKLPEMK